VEVNPEIRGKPLNSIAADATRTIWLATQGAGLAMGMVKITNPQALGRGVVSIPRRGTSTGYLQIETQGANTITNTFAGFNSGDFGGGVPTTIENLSGTNTLTSGLRVKGTRMMNWRHPASRDGMELDIVRQPKPPRGSADRGSFGAFWACRPRGARTHRHRKRQFVPRRCLANCPVGSLTRKFDRIRREVTIPPVSREIPENRIANVRPETWLRAQCLSQTSTKN
jgi:hypothetical protein